MSSEETLAVIKSADTPALQQALMQGCCRKSDNMGVLIQNIFKNSPAEKSGLIIGDIIIMFNNVKIVSFSELIEVLSLTRVGDTVPVKYIREGNIQSSSITLSAFPENQK